MNVFNLRRNFIPCVVIFPILLAGCKGKDFQLSQADEISFGTAAIRSLELKNPPGEANAQRMRNVGKLLVGGTKRRVVYSFHALSVPETAAISLPGGPVAVTNSLLNRLSDEQLEAVVAHELGHLENNHFAVLYHRRKDALAITGFLTGGLSLLKVATNEKLVKRWAFAPHWSPEEEAAADQTGMRLLSIAGKSPSLLLDWLESPLEEYKIDKTRIQAAHDYANSLEEATLPVASSIRKEKTSKTDVSD